MSASGPKRTSIAAPHMSAFGGKADMAIGSDKMGYRKLFDDLYYGDDRAGETFIVGRVSEWLRPTKI